MLWVMLWCTIMGFLFQLLSSRLGIVTKQNLARASRRAYPLHIRWILWFTAEIAIIASDIPEVIGTAFALKLLFGLQLWIGIVITALDTILFLMLQFFGMRILELVIGTMVATIVVGFVIEMFMSKTPAGPVAYGLFVPQLSSRDSIYSALSLLGAVVMPHNLYLHSALVQSRDFGETDRGKKEAIFFNGLESGVALSVSLLVNVAIIVLAGTYFYPNTTDIGLDNASELLANVFHGKWAGVIFGIALLASGQSSTITGTLAGQYVMDGYLEMRMPGWLRNLVTRGAAIAPSLIIALAFDEHGSDWLIVFSSVLLALQLPFTLIPLLRITNDEQWMGREHVNSLMMQAIGWFLAALVMGANIYLTVTQILNIFENQAISKLARISVMVCAGILALIYVLFAIYLSCHPLKQNLPEGQEEGGGGCCGGGGGGGGGGCCGGGGGGGEGGDDNAEDETSFFTRHLIVNDEDEFTSDPFESNALYTAMHR
jgi:manganese transport protein